MAQRKTLVRGGTGLRISSAPRRLHIRNSDSADVGICPRAGSPRPRRVLIPRWPTFDAEEGKPVPVGSGDGIGHGGERLVIPTVPLEAVRQCCDGMSDVLPLPDHLRAGFNAAAAKHGVRIAIANGVGDIPEPTFRCNR